MGGGRLASRIGQRIELPGHFDVPVILEEARPLGDSDGAGYECRVRLPDGSLAEAVISGEEAAALKRCVANWRADRAEGGTTVV
ncbi:MAG TPA: hypothetical protein VNJ11_11120 [Bryobacteraceae bacterium]|nr:hypothetical protein [Bryobacteraceae bacterium]